MMRRKNPALLALILLFAGAEVFAQGDIPRANTVVKPKAFVSHVPVPRGGAVEVAVVAEILKGYHINSNKPKEDYLIPTTLSAELPASLKLLETNYPKGAMQRFEFSDTALEVYDGTITIRMKLQVAPGTPTGTVKLPLALRYQACNDRACLPPVKLPLAAELQIAEAGAKSVAQHPNVFGKSPAR